MTDDRLAELVRSAVKEEVKPLHGKLARIDSSIENLSEEVKKLSEN